MVYSLIVVINFKERKMNIVEWFKINQTEKNRVFNLYHENYKNNNFYFLNIDCKIFLLNGRPDI